MHLSKISWRDLKKIEKSVSCLQKFSSFAKQESIRDEYQKTDENHHHGYALSNSQIKAIRLLKNQYSKGDSDNLSSSSRTISSPLEFMKEQSMKHDLEHEQEKPSPWYNLLMHPSRALWRSSPQLPPKYMIDLQSNLIQKSGRKLKQLKRTYERILHQQKALLQSRESERRRLVRGIMHRRQYKAKETNQDQQEHQDGVVHPIYYKPEYTLSSLKFRLVPNYSITKRVLAETQSLLGIHNFQPKRILDVGCGIGSASAAVLEYFRDGRGYDRGYTIQWIHGIDPSQSMRDSAQYLLQDIIQQSKYQEQEKQQIGLKSNNNDNHNYKTRITFSDSLTSSSSISVPLSSSNKKNTGDNNSSKGFDLALCVYTLSEIPSVAAVLSMAAIIWEKVTINGVVIFIEPGTPDGFNALRSVRSMLLDCCPPNASSHHHHDTDKLHDVIEQCHVIAPCTHNGTCPMERHRKDFINKKEKKLEDTFDDWADEDGVNDNNFWEDSKLEEYGLQTKEDQQASSIDAMEDDETDDDDIDVDMETQIAENSDPIPSSALETNAFSSAFCSFVHGMPGGTTRTSGEKFTYLVVQKRTSSLQQSSTIDSESSNPSDLFTHVSLVDLLNDSIREGERQYKLDNKSESNINTEGPWKRLLREVIELEDAFVQSNEDKLGLELVRGDRNRHRFGRIIRAPIKKKGHVIVDYCGGNVESALQSEGRIIRHKISRGKSIRLAPGMFAASRKARWGGLWPDIRT